ncbi:O-antigen ligase family protein [Endozoicomonas lisbonensis]|uniref:O-antigen ligase-related domain-containing protein n=1 Tax=Endozoicomonas lisbonensis TaxID=3120522 RepID=A0ABV2SII8_9GAMM
MQRFRAILLVWLSIGLFVQLSGNMWLPSGSSHAAQINLWFMLPCLLLLATYANRFTDVIKTREELFIVLFILWFVISALWTTSDKSGVFNKYVRYGAYVLVYLAGITLIYLKKPKYLLHSIDVAMLVVAIGAIITFYLQVFGAEASLSYRETRIHEMGIGEFGKFSTPLQSANYFGAFTILAFGRLLNENNKVKVVIFSLLTFIFFSYVFLTGSRGPLVGVVFAIIACLLTLRPKLILPACLISITSIIALIVLTTDVSSLNINPENFDSVMASVTSDRWFVWEKAIANVLAERPVIGFGADAHMAFYNPLINFTYYHPHSGFVLVTYETGLAGLFLYVLSMGSVIIASFKLLNVQHVKIALGLLAFSFIAMLTDVHKVVTRPHEYWVFLWLPVGLILAAKRERVMNADDSSSSRQVKSELEYSYEVEAKKKQITQD